MERRNPGFGPLVAVMLLAAGAVATPAADEPYRIRGEVVVSTDDLGRVVFAVDADGPDGPPDGRVDELYLLAPARAGAFDVGPRSLSGVVVWSKADGYVAVFDRSGVERWALTTAPRPTAQAVFQGVELVRVAGEIDGSLWDVDTTAIPSALNDGGGESPVSGGLEGCQSGGVGAMSCSRRCTNIGGLAGGTSCDVSCGSGYYACCQCTAGVVARCYCRLAPRPLEGVGDGEKPSSCFPNCAL